MKPTFRSLAAAACLIATFGALPASAAPNDYAFEPVSVDVRNGKGSELAVRIIHKPTGKAVEGAVVFRTRLDMSPESMEAMTADHEALPSTEPGVYRFTADLTMEGSWALKLMAKIQGEPDTVTGTVIFKAKD
jgi:hypothetical protein